MANSGHLAILKRGATVWNEWRSLNPRVRPDLREADLSGRRRSFHRINLREADLRRANLNRTYFSEAFLYAADFSGADLSDADFNTTYAVKARFRGAKLNNTFFNLASLDQANLRGANLSGADLYRTSLRGSDLRDAMLLGTNLTGAFLMDTDLEGATLSGCVIHGISAWNVNVKRTTQSDLIITTRDEPTIQVDNLEIAQFIYLLLNNSRIRHLIEAITSKVVLILGRFTKSRKLVLDGIRDELRRRNYSPVLFDFQKPANRSFTETVSTLAHLARFVIADITNAKSIPQELMTIVPQLPHVPIQPILLEGSSAYGMFEHFRAFPWVLPVVGYQNPRQLLRSIRRVIGPAERWLESRPRR